MEHFTNQEAEKAFGVFIGLYNRSNGTNFTVKSARENAFLFKTFRNCQAGLALAHAHGTRHATLPSPRISTRRASLARLDVPEVDEKVYQQIQLFPGYSRSELSQLLGYRLSTVCGAVNRLMKQGLVFVCGRKKDPETGKTVEVLNLTGGDYNV